MDVNKKVLENLKAFGLDTDIKPTTLKHLAKVDAVLSSITQGRADAIQEIKSNKVSINKVAKDSGIARQTFYNNPIISAYINAYVATYMTESPYETIETLRSEIRRKDEQIAGLVQRDATISKCKAENLELTNEVSSLRETIHSQEKLIFQLQIKLNNIIPK